MTAHLLDGVNLNCCTCCNSMSISTCLCDNINLLFKVVIIADESLGPEMMCGFSKKRQFFKNVNLYHYIQLCNLFSWIGNSFSKFAIAISYRMCKSRVRIEIQLNCVPVNQEKEIMDFTI